MFKTFALVVCVLAGTAFATPALAAGLDDDAVSANQCLTVPDGSDKVAPGPACGCIVVHSTNTCAVTPNPDGSWGCQGKCYRDGQVVGQCLWAFPDPTLLPVIAGVPTEGAE